MTANLPAIPKPFALHHDEILSAVDAAMKSVGVAVQLMMGDTEPQRFTEAKRMVAIGQALSRMRGRLTRRVGDVGPRRRARQRYGGFVCGPNDMDDDIDPDDEDNGGRFANPMMPMGAGPIGAPHFGGDADVLGDVAGILGPVVQQIAEITASRDASGDQSRLRLDRTRELESLIRCRDLLPDDERPPIQLRIDAVTQAIAAPEADTPETVEDGPEEYDTDVHDTEAVEKPERRVHCYDCGNSHDEHWVTDDGSPRNCDVCNAPMSFDLPDQPQPQPQP